MNKNLEKAKEMLAGSRFTCVICRGESVFTSELRGVTPLLLWLDSDEDLKGFCAADKVVGNAAAFLYVLLGVSAVYADIMSEKAWETLEVNGIEASCALEVKHIINRTKTGLCPMEQAVSGITEPQDALKAIRKRLNELSRVQ